MRTSITAAAVAAAAFLGAAGIARAQSTPDLFNVDEFKPAIDPYGYAVVNGARSLAPWQLHAAAYVNWAKNPIEFDPALGVPRGNDIIRELTMLDIVAGLGLIQFGNGGV